MSGFHTLIRSQRGRAWHASRKFSHATCTKSAVSVQKSGPEIPKMGAQTIAQMLTSSATHKYMGKLGKAHKTSVNVLATDMNGSVKTEIARLLREKRYDALLKTLGRWTSRASEMPWQNVLTPREMAHVLRQLVEYQRGILFKFGTLQMMGKSAVLAPESARAHVREVREQIRAVYANLLGGGSGIGGSKNLHLYSKEAGYLEQPSAVSRSGYVMRAADYENMISLELNNAKLDLAAKWFRRMQLQYGASLYENMTPTLWTLKFRVLGNAQPSLWRVERSKFSDVIVDPRQSRLKHQHKWLDLFNEYTKQQQVQSAQKSRVTFTNDLVAVMLASISYGQNVDQAARLVEVNWGLTLKGELVPGFVKPTVSDPLFPNLEVLSTVAVAMIFNRRFVAAMAYINGFQTHYNIELNKNSRRFWDQVFRWADISTRYSEARAFQYFVSESGQSSGSVFGSTEDFPAALAQAQKTPDFDYEGFLAFVNDVRRQRVGLLSELWRCFHEADPGFSARAFRTYLQLAQDYLKPSVVSTPFEREQLCSEMCYDILQRLAVHHRRYSVAADSYNGYMVAGTVSRIRHLYTKTLQLLIEAKGQTGLLGEIPHITRKWALDAEMRVSLDQWAQLHEQKYLEQMHALEAQRLAEDEDVGFLDLM